MARPKAEAFQGDSVPTPPRIIDAKWDGRSTFDLPEVAEILNISPWSAYEAAKKGQIPFIEIGRRKIVPRRVLERMLDPVSAA
jgi:hypothetical protein